MAIRPKTLPAAVSPVLVGTALAINKGVFNALPALAALFGALLLQILSNLANDYYDFIKGVDTVERQGPVRVAASGLISLDELKRGILVNIIVVSLIGLYLIYVGGWLILIIGIFSIIFALLYSGGPYPLSSIGLGDLFVFIFFGLVAVSGTYYVQALNFHRDVWIIATPVGLLITGILIVNNYRDIETDKDANKFTIAVFLGHRKTQFYYLFIIISSYFVPLLMLLLNYSFFVLLPLLTLPIAYSLVKNIFTSNEGTIMNKSLANTAKLSLQYSILFAIGIML